MRPRMPLFLALSEDETLVLVLSLAIWGLAWVVGAAKLRSGPRLGVSRVPAWLAGATAVLSIALVFVALRRWASWDVRDSGEYLFQYVALGGAWTALGGIAFRWLGLSLRDDVAERGNLAASVAWCGAWLGLTLCYVGGNVGDGPGWWVVVGAAGLASLALLGAWIALERLARPSEAIAIDRDLATGVRHAAFSLACGAILGRAVAGDWVSGLATIGDLARDGWPVVALLGLGIGFEHALRPRAEAPRRSVILCGILPALVYLASAWVWIASRGSWS